MLGDVMKLSATRIKQLEHLLDELGLKYKDQDIEWIALAIVRFVYTKELRKAHGINPNSKEMKHG